MVVRTQLEEFYRGKSVFLTGHTGFKGGWLALWLKELGADVSGLALRPADGKSSFFSRAQVAKGMESAFGDIRDFEVVLKNMRRAQPEIVFHNAAQALVLRSYRDPLETYATNVMGTVHVLEAARRIPSVRAVVIVTSDKCYENRNLNRGYHEEDPMGGYDPYSSSKGCAELVTSAYRRSFSSNGQGPAIASGRAGNVIGGGDWAQDRLLPDIVRGITAKRTIPIRNPQAIRPWQHVLEPLRGYLLLGRNLWKAKKRFAGAWNFGPHETAHSVGDVARRVVRLWGAGQLKIHHGLAGPHEARYLKLDCKKAHSLLGWRSLLSLEQTLFLTVDWYRTIAEDHGQAPAKTSEQIRQYMEMPC